MYAPPKNPTCSAHAVTMPAQSASLPDTPDVWNTPRMQMNMTDKAYWEVGLKKILDKAPHVSGSNQQALSCFLDAENLDKIEELSMLVAGCDVLVCVLSDVSGLTPPCAPQSLDRPPPRYCRACLILTSGRRSSQPRCMRACQSSSC